MSQWAERFRDHNLWKNLEQLGPAIDQANVLSDPNPEVSESLGRLKIALTFIGKRLSTCDPMILDLSRIDAVDSSIQTAIAELGQFQSTRSIEHLRNANSQIDVSLGHIGIIPVPSNFDDLFALRESVNQYREVIEQSLRKSHDLTKQLFPDFEGLQSRVQDLAAEIASEKSRLTSLASEHQSQFSTAQENRSAEYSNSQSKRQELFASLQAEYSQKLAELEKDSFSRRDEIHQQHSAEIGKLKASFVSRAEGLQQEIESHLRNVEKLVGVIGNLGVTAGYQRAANGAKKATWIWQFVTVVSMGALIWIAYDAFLSQVTTDFSWPAFATRTLILIAMGALAGYAGWQADKYHQDERRNRRLALELEAIGPYLAPLPVDKQQEFRLRIGEKTFGQGDTVSTKEERSPINLVDLLTKYPEFKDFVREIVKLCK